MREIEEIIARALRHSCIDHLQVEPGVTITPGMVADVIAALDAAGLVIAQKEHLQTLAEWIATWDRVCDAADPDDDEPPSWEEVQKKALPDWEASPSAEYWSAYMKGNLVYAVRDLVHSTQERQP